jgi:uncharacterized protein
MFPTLIDTGPLVALFNPHERRHALCMATIAALSSPLHTTWAVITEAMYFLQEERGIAGQRALWQFLILGKIEVHHLDATTFERCHALIEKYADTPMDLADATLVMLAEILNCRRIFTLDSDFMVYRINGHEKFDIIPDLNALD